MTMIVRANGSVIESRDPRALSAVAAFLLIVLGVG